MRLSMVWKRTGGCGLTHCRSLAAGSGWDKICLVSTASDDLGFAMLCETVVWLSVYCNVCMLYI